ncbi:MAG: hypothetical protein HY743_13500 [Deltaproteobacteria bacterium]|nr:hypothetical protein [Deltaproteobacteria bacterium]
MDIPLARKLDGKKFMWDGGTYETEDQAQQVMHGYEKDGFETRMLVEGNHYLVYSLVQSGE